MPLLVYFAPVRVAPRRLLDGRAHTGSSAKAASAAHRQLKTKRGPASPSRAKGRSAAKSTSVGEGGGRAEEEGDRGT